MLTIRDAQREALRSAREHACLRRVAACLRESFPREAAALGDAGLEEVIRPGMAKCRSYGAFGERDIYLYLTLMFMLGAEFDEDPQLEWAGERLRRGGARDSGWIGELHTETLRYLDEVAGEENQHLVRAIVRARDFDYEALGAMPEEGFPGRIAAFLRVIYPSKYARQGEVATLAVVETAVGLSEKYSMPGNASAGLLALLGFMLGSGFHRDPLYPWASEALQMRVDTEDKRKELHRRMVAFAGVALN